ncbi:hypothetical protein Esti_001698 [Eimeria stiedai]
MLPQLFPPAAVGHQELRDAMRLPHESPEVADVALTGFAYNREDTQLAHWAYRRGHQRNPPVARLLTAVVALLLIGVLLAFICKRQQSRGSLAGTIQRRLAQAGEGDEDLDDELQDVLQGCLEIENEYGFSALIPHVEVQEPAAKKARIVSLIQDAFSEYQRAVQSSFSKVQSSTFNTAYEQRGGTTEPSDQEEHLQSFEALWSPDPIPPWSASQDLESGRIIQTLDADLWLESIPSILEEGEFATEVRPEGRAEGLGSEELLTAKRESEPQSTGRSVLDDSSISVVEGAPASFLARPAAHSKSERTEGEIEKAGLERLSHATYPAFATATPALWGEGSGSGGPWNKDEHPFTRLPVVRPGAVQRYLHPQRFHSDFGVGFSTFSVLNTIRELYLRPFIGADEAETLMCALETLVYIARAKLRLRSPGRLEAPSYLIEKLSTYFMVYDSLVCGIELFGEKMNLDKWWSEFVRDRGKPWRDDDWLFTLTHRGSSDDSEEAKDT